MKLANIEVINRKHKGNFIYNKVLATLVYHERDYKVKAVITASDVDEIIEDVTFMIDKEIHKEMDLRTDYTGKEWERIEAYVNEVLRSTY